jgi:uncharacterized protein YdhG (YjbR/CyaY superfamily)
MKTTGNKNSTAKSSAMDDYIASHPSVVASRLRSIRREVHAAIPTVAESISYGIPAFSENGKRFFYMAAWKGHIALYPVTSGSEAFMKAVSRYRGTKSALHFKHDTPLPLALVRRIVKECYKRYFPSAQRKKE